MSVSFVATTNATAIDDFAAQRKQPLEEQEGVGLHQALKVAYDRHCAVELSPDVIKLSLLAQFAAFVNGASEQLRSKFTKAEQGKTEVLVVYDAHENPTPTEMANDLTAKLAEHVPEPKIVDWITTQFSTSSAAHIGAGSVAALATTQTFYDFRVHFRCGIPQVTLLGELDDWKKLRAWIDTLLEFGGTSDADESDGKAPKNPMRTWHAMLVLVLDRLVACYENPTDGKQCQAFFDCLHSNTRHGSGSDTYAGWAVVFSAFNADGKWALRDTAPLADISATNGFRSFGVLHGAAASGIVQAPMKITGASPLVGSWFLSSRIGYSISGVDKAGNATLGAKTASAEVTAAKWTCQITTKITLDKAKEKPQKFR